MGISSEQALDCFRSDDLVGIGMEADAVRRRLHPEGVVSYAVGSSVDCGAGAALDAARVAIAASVERGGTDVRLRFGGAAGDAVEAAVRSVRRQFPEVWLEGLSAAELIAIAAGWGLGLAETIARLNDAGLNSICGDGADLSASGVVGRCSVAEWVAVHRAAHELGIRTEATLMFGAGETLEQRVSFLQAVRELQEETGGFAAFVPVAADAPGGRELDGVTAVERLKTLAIGRMFLDNVENVQTIGAVQGLKVLQMGLRLGANDVGVVAESRGSEEDVRRIIRDAGFRPAERDAAYRAMMLA
ncbi:MAG TPA: dehypoxanthine futalosine cyclase [Acidobacteriaceae bacterium]